MTVHEAVLALRKQTGESQQKFATRLDMSISALNNYQDGRIPEPRQLLMFLRAAKAAKRADLAKVFRKAFFSQLGLRDASALCQIIQEEKRD